MFKPVIAIILTTFSLQAFAASQNTSFQSLRKQKLAQKSAAAAEINNLVSLSGSDLAKEIAVRGFKTIRYCGLDAAQMVKHSIEQKKVLILEHKKSAECTQASNSLNKAIDVSISKKHALEALSSQTLQYQATIFYPNYTSLGISESSGGDRCLYIAAQTFSHWSERRNFAPVGYQAQDVEHLTITETLDSSTSLNWNAFNVRTSIWEFGTFDPANQQIQLISKEVVADSDDAVIVYRYSWNLTLTPGQSFGKMTLYANYSDAHTGFGPTRAQACQISMPVDVRMSALK
ncbi:MAG: hypothetical protein AABZ31_10250 [Bdellovibrionota bacterium]